MSGKTLIGLVLCTVLLFVLFTLPLSADSAKISNADFLRIHIRANSNSEVDQNVKYEVKDAVVKFLTPLLCDVVDKQSAINIVSNNLKNIEKVCNTVLKESGFNYASEAVIKQENFPTRTYNEVTLTSGVYDSLIVNLGTGKGNNWWCVVYPPLCFVNAENSNNLTYRSKLLEIINSFWRR